MEEKYEIDILKNDIKKHQSKLEWLEAFNRHQEENITKLVNIIDMLKTEIGYNRTYINAIISSQGLPELPRI